MRHGGNYNGENGAASALDAARKPGNLALILAKLQPATVSLGFTFPNVPAHPRVFEFVVYGREVFLARNVSFSIYRLPLSESVSQKRVRIWLKSHPPTQTCRYCLVLSLFPQYALLASFFRGIRAKINKPETRKERDGIPRGNGPCLPMREPTKKVRNIRSAAVRSSINKLLGRLCRLHKPFTRRDPRSRATTNVA